MLEPERFNLLTLLPGRSAEKVDRAAPAGACMLHAPDSTAFRIGLRSRRWSAIVVDPTALSEEALLAAALHANAEGQSLICLSPTTWLAARRLVIAARYAPVHVLFVDCESTDRLLALEMGHLGSPSVRAVLLKAIAPAVDVLPRSFCAGVVSLFGILPLPQSSAAFARGISCSRRTVDRWACRAGFRGVGCLLRSVRLAWAWELTRATASDMWMRVYGDCGYRSARTLRVHSRRLLGLAPGELCTMSFGAELIERLRQAAVGPSRRRVHAGRLEIR